MKGIVYCIFGDASGIYKIGSTKRKVDNRLFEMSTGRSDELSVLWQYECINVSCFQLEAMLHRRLKRKLIKGEWYSVEKEEALSLLEMVKKSDIAFGELNR